MIYLIGGSPRTGKTTLTNLLAEKLSFPYFTLDHVTSVISPFIPKQDYAKKLPLAVARQETNFSNDVFYAKYSAQQIVGFYLRQAETYWQGIRNFIEYAIEDNHDLILEGWQILPHLLHKIVTSENRGELKMIFLCKKNLENIVLGLKANIAKNDWVIKNTKNEETFLAIAKMVSEFSLYIEEQAKEYEFQSINTDFNFEQKLQAALETKSK